MFNRQIATASATVSHILIEDISPCLLDLPKNLWILNSGKRILGLSINRPVKYFHFRHFSKWTSYYAIGPFVTAHLISLDYFMLSKVSIETDVIN